VGLRSPILDANSPNIETTYKISVLNTICTFVLIILSLSIAIDFYITYAKELKINYRLSSILAKQAEEDKSTNIYYYSLGVSNNWLLYIW